MLKDDKHFSIGYYSFFKNIDESALKRTIGKMLAQYLTQLAQQDENWTGEKHETNESQVTINRVCPNCGENIESIVVTEGNNEVIKTIFPKSFDGKKDFILPQNFGFMIWDNLYQKKLIDNISQLSMDSIEDLFQEDANGDFVINYIYIYNSNKCFFQVASDAKFLSEIYLLGILSNVEACVFIFWKKKRII